MGDNFDDAYDEYDEYLEDSIEDDSFIECSDSVKYKEPENLNGYVEVSFKALKVITKEDRGANYGAILIVREDDTENWIPKFRCANLNLMRNTVWVQSDFAVSELGVS